MNNAHRLRECRIKASLLLKQLKSPDEAAALQAAKRFQLLHFLSGKSADEILAIRSTIRLKHAYMTIALEKGYSSWSELKRRIITEDCLCPPVPNGCLHAWYKDYATAKKHQQIAGGYLLQYRQHFFVCEEAYIEVLGLAHLQDEWQRIAYDWAQPADMEAWHTLFYAAQMNYLQKV